jgi:hypothetical protein
MTRRMFIEILEVDEKIPENRLRFTAARQVETLFY